MALPQYLRPRHIEAHELVVLLDQISGNLLAPKLPSEALDLVLEDIRETFEEDKGEDVVLEFGGVQRASYGTRRFPEPPLKGRDVQRIPALGLKGTSLSISGLSPTQTPSGGMVTEKDCRDEARTPPSWTQAASLLRAQRSDKEIEIIE